MLRISHYLRALAQPAIPVLGARSTGTGRPPVVIWNLLRRCNLPCKHCYATSADSVFRDELDTGEALKVIDDLHDAGVRVLILSGGSTTSAQDRVRRGHFALTERRVRPNGLTWLLRRWTPAGRFACDRRDCLAMSLAFSLRAPFLCVFATIPALLR